jgi:Uma2 family endonuclease
MATVTKRSGVFTYDDFCARVSEEQKADLIDGVIYMASPENTDANELMLWLAALMTFFAQRNKLGKVYGSRVACRFDDKNAPEPDILFVLAANLNRVKRGGIAGPADLAMEIVSPDSVERDYVKKKKQYQRFGIREYWIIDQEEKKVTLFRLDDKGKYREVRPRRGVFHSNVLMGFWLDPNWLWQETLPDLAETLQAITK